MSVDYKGSLARYRRYLQAIQHRPLWQASFVVIMSLGLVIVLILSALRPTLVTIAGLLGQIGQQKTVEEKMDQKIATIQKATEQFQRYQDRLTVLDEALPKSPMWGRFAKEVTAIASESGVEIKNLTVGPIDQASVSFNLTAVGTYPVLQKLAGVVNNLKRVAVISYVSFSQEKNSATTLTMKGTVGFGPDSGGK